MKSSLLTLLVFGLIITLHETGHFIVAKLFHVCVREFSFGMGPVLWHTRKKGTQYSVRAFPIGGYVAMDEEDSSGSGFAGAEIPVNGESPPEGEPLCRKPAWQRILIFIAGAFMNIILGFIILTGLTAKSDLIGTRTIAGFEEGGVSAGYLSVGDEITDINGCAIRCYNDAVFQLFRDEDGIVDFTVRRNNEKVTVTVPFETETVDKNQLAVKVDFQFLGVKPTFSNSLRYAWRWTFSIVKQVWYSLSDIIGGRYGLKALSGPVGTARVISKVSSRGLKNFLNLVALITVNVGVFNLLPFPALDGGRILFVLIEFFCGKPVPKKYEEWFHRAGFVLLMLLFAAVTINDIIDIMKVIGGRG